MNNASRVIPKNRMGIEPNTRGGMPPISKSKIALIQNIKNTDGHISLTNIRPINTRLLLQPVLKSHTSYSLIKYIKIRTSITIKKILKRWPKRKVTGIKLKCASI